MKRFNTAQAAKAAGVKRTLLQMWIKRGRFQPPPLTTRRKHHKRPVRLWSEKDIRRLKEFKARRDWIRWHMQRARETVAAMRQARAKPKTPEVK